MNRIGKIAICLVGGLVCNMTLHAGQAKAINVAVGDPYTPIVERNVFGLLPPPPPPDPNAAAQVDLPKITANGIMNVFGNLKVLFKASSGKPGSKDNYYDLAEGQSEDNIEVMQIDEKAGMVTFKNNGTEQQIALATEPSSGGGGGGGGGMPGGFNGGGNPGFSGGNGGGGGGGNQFPRPGGYPGGYSGGNNGGNNGGYSGGSPGGSNVGNNALNFNGQSIQNRVFPAPKMDITPDQQTILMEANRANLQAQGNPMANIIPPTPVTGMLNGSDGGNGDGNTGDNSQ